MPSTHSIYADSNDNSAFPVCDLFYNYRADVAVVTDREIHTWELTICHETNMLKSCAYKQNRYIHIDSAATLLAGDKKTVTHKIEVSTLGFVSNVSDFTKSINIPSLPINLKQSIIWLVL